MASYQQSGPANFKELAEPLPEAVREVATELREIIRAALPNADEAVSGGVKMGMVLYSVDGPNNVVCGIQPTESMCKLFFHGWGELQQAGYRLDGSGKYARHIKIRSSDEIEPREVVNMIQIVSGRL